MSNPVAALTNLGRKFVRRAARLHKPFVRGSRRVDRARAYLTVRRGEGRVAREIAKVARGEGPIVVGPWLSEVGYEVLYWIPFLRWFERTYDIDPDRVVAISRGGVSAWYADLASRYVDLFDEFTPEEFAVRNDARRRETEGGGQKQSASGGFDADILARVDRRTGLSGARVLHPALMFRLFREFWLGNQTFDFLWRRTSYAPMHADPPGVPLPAAYTAVKFYSGIALPPTARHRAAVRSIVERLAESGPVVLLDTGLAVDEHQDYAFEDVANVHNLAPSLKPSNNLGIQTSVIAGARAFVGTCGSVAWMAPLLGVPTAALYADDKLLTTHLTVARHVYRALGTPAFDVLDLRALERVPVFDRPNVA